MYVHSYVHSYIQSVWYMYFICIKMLFKLFSDDIPCPYAGDFRCAHNGVCIRATLVCNGYENCLDGSDEGMNC